MNLKRILPVVATVFAACASVRYSTSEVVYVVEASGGA